MRAVVEVECENPELVKKAVEIEKDDAFDVNLEIKKNMLVLNVKAEKISSLMAGINSYLRLINACVSND